MEKIGIKKNWIYEALIETGREHITPAGVYTTDQEKIKINLYPGKSLKNLQENPTAIIYLIEDTLDLQIKDRKKAEEKTSAKIKVELEKIKPEGDYSTLTFKIKEIEPWSRIPERRYALIPTGR